MQIKTFVALFAVVATASIATAVALATDSTSSKSTASVKVTTRSVAGLGRILVNSSGRTLYMFVPDKRKKVTCFKVCAKIWPPVKLKAGAKILAAGGVKKALLGSDKYVGGVRVVTYNHWPLYTYLGDRKAGAVTGQALDLNGGLWYVLNTAGKVIKKKPGSGGGGGGGTTTTKTTTSPTTTTSPSACSDDDADGDGNAGGPDDGDGCI